MTKRITAQAVFDLVADHLFTQGTPAVDAYGECQYRGPEGRKCAVGAIIPDDKYNPAMEGFNVTDARVFIAMPDEFAPHRKLLLNLQNVHDRVRDEEKMVIDTDGRTVVPRMIKSAWTSPEALFEALVPVAQAFNVSAEKFRNRQFGREQVTA